MFLKQIDLTTALRPAYLPEEVLLFVQDNVGLYEGKYKLPNQQNGQVYLTSHRICYVDKTDPRRQSVGLDLKSVERYEFYGRFLKSSPKVTLIPKPSKRSSVQSRSPALGSAPSRSGTSSPLHRSESPYRSVVNDGPPASAATWVCPICSFSNPVPSNFDPHMAGAHTPLPPCLSCGVKPTLALVLKAAVANAAKRAPVTASPGIRTPLPVRPRSVAGLGLETAEADQSPESPTAPPTADPDANFQCPRCTFSNHPSLLSCEICGAPLISHDVPQEILQPQARPESPGPMLNYAGTTGVDNPESVKISFRGGGEKIFYERLKGCMVQRKWLLQGAPPIPKSTIAVDASADSSREIERPKIAGIAGLEQRGRDLNRNNELVIGTAFEDLEALMASAKQVIALAEKFSGQVNGGATPADGSSEASAALLAQSASAELGLVTTKDIVGSGSGSGANESLYLSELARNLAEFVTDNARGVLRRAGGIISLVDLWAAFNRARGGVELVSPLDFERAARLWEKLRLPVRLRTFKSGVMVVQGRDCTDATTIKALLAWLRDLHDVPPARDVAWDWQEFGRGVTAQDAAERFGWSLGVAEEELEMAEERGVLCREEGIEGLKFWENFIDTGEGRSYQTHAQDAQANLIKALSDAGFL